MFGFIDYIRESNPTLYNVYVMTVTPLIVACAINTLLFLGRRLFLIFTGIHLGVNYIVMFTSMETRTAAENSLVLFSGIAIKRYSKYLNKAANRSTTLTIISLIMFIISAIFYKASGVFLPATLGLISIVFMAVSFLYEIELRGIKNDDIVSQTIKSIKKGVEERTQRVNKITDELIEFQRESMFENLPKKPK